MSQVQQVSFKTRVSGASTVTVTSGFSTVYEVLIYPMSGGPPNTSSGLTIQVFDGISGVGGNTNSGTLVWSFAFGSQSGTGGSAPVIEPLTGVVIPCNSGIVATSVAGWNTEIVYAQ